MLSPRTPFRDNFRVADDSGVTDGKGVYRYLLFYRANNEITLVARSAHPLGGRLRTLRGLPGHARQICRPEWSANSQGTAL